MIILESPEDLISAMTVEPTNQASGNMPWISYDDFALENLHGDQTPLNTSGMDLTNNPTIMSVLSPKGFSYQH